MNENDETITLFTEKKFTIREAAKILNISEKTLYFYAKNKLIAHYKFFGKIVFSEKQLQEFIKQSEIQAEKEGKL